MSFQDEIYLQTGVPLSSTEEPSPTPAALETYARLEGLVGEEDALLDVAREERRHDQHERLRTISGELDRVWERLRERAEHRARPSP